MRTTLNIAPDLMRRAREAAHKRQTTLTAILETALRDYLASTDAPGTEYKLEIPTVDDAGPPLVDFADRDALYEAMEGRS